MELDRVFLNYLFTCVFMVLLIGCGQNPNESENMPALHSEAKKVFLNTEEGYTINKFTKDSVNVLLDTNGAPIETGRILQAESELISFDTNIRVIEMTAEPQVIESQSNTFDLGELKRSKINKDSLEVWRYGDGDQDYVLQNNRDSIIPTGKLLPFNGREENAVMGPLLKVLEMEQNPFPEFGQKMIVDGEYNLETSNFVEDSSGSFWSGYKNLMRNDGVCLQTFLNNIDGENRIEKLMLDSKGNIWFINFNWNVKELILTEYLVKFDGKKFTYYSNDNGLYIEIINKIYEASDSAIWVASTKGVLLKIKNDCCTYITPKEGMILEDINDIAEGPNNEMWFATDNGVVKLKSGKWIKYDKKSGFFGKKVNAIHKDINENLWFGTDKGIYLLKDDSLIPINNTNGVLGEIVYRIESNQFGNVMIGSHRGMSIIDLKSNTITHVLHLGPYLENGIFHYGIESIECDKEGNFWINKWGSLYRFPVRSNYVRNESIAQICFISEDGEKIMLLGNNEFGDNIAMSDKIKRGFVVEKNGVMKYFTLEDISKNEKIYEIIKVNEDYWFLSSYHQPDKYTGLKLYRFRNNKCEDFSELLSFFEYLPQITVDSENVVWIYGAGNLIKYENEQFEQISFPDLGQELVTYGMFRDSKGNVWFGTKGGGIVKYKNDSYTIYSEREGMSGGGYPRATEDKNGSIWIKSNNGLDKFDGVAFYHYSEEQGLWNERIGDVKSDVNGNLWVLTYDSVLEELKLNLILVNTDSSGKDTIYSLMKTGLESTEHLNKFSRNNFDLTDHNVYAGYQNLVTINVDKYNSIAKNTPVVHMNNVLINDQFYDYRSITDGDSLKFRFDSIANFYNYPLGLKLDYDQNDLTFNYAGVNWNAPGKIEYTYKLEGLESDWNKITKETTIDYRGLSPGKYTFKVCAIGESKQWSEPFIYSFRIRPPWWLTGVAKGVYVLGGIFLLILFTRWRMRKFRKRQIQLEQEVAAATQVIIQQKEEVEKQHEEVVQAYEKLEFQKKVVEAKNREITDSITYAKRLQNAILPPAKLVKEWLNDSFIFYKPKAIVAGDFYWMEVAKRNGRNIVFYAAADCTGHGVPGAMVSVVCSNALNRAVKEFKINDPAVLLDVVSRLVQESFAQSDEIIRDGMDIAICAVDLVEKKIWFAGANNPLYRITDIDVEVPDDVDVVESGKRKLVEYKPDKQAVGDGAFDLPYHTTEIQLVPGDCLYIFSDGFADQFGGDKGKKYKSANFKSFLLQIEGQEMEAQRLILDTEIERWKGEYEQVDDICVIGLRVNGHMGKIFTKRELEVIQKISEGKPSKIIAEELKIAKNTVDTHRKRIMAKTNAHNSTELINFCKKHEII